MQPNFWHERWRGGKIGFHQSTVGRQLKEYWPSLNLPRGCTVFVPLCGKSLDLLWLRDERHEVIGVELSEVAIESFCMENGIPARRTRSDGFDEYRSLDMRLLCGDFFELKPHVLGAIPAVYDRAALVSWTPDLRTRYVERMTELTPSGCQTLLITLEYSQAETDGPPFSVDRECVDGLYRAHHDIRQLYREDVLAQDPRLRARGVTQLHEACYLLTRR